MKKISLWLVFFLLIDFHAWSEETRNGNNNASQVSTSSGRVNSGRTAAPEVSRPPVVINLGSGSSGGYNQNYPIYSNSFPESPAFEPSYGQLNWNSQVTSPPSAQEEDEQYTQEAASSASNPPYPSSSYGFKTALAIHHHPYTPGYVRKRLQRIGVTKEPSIITNRAEIIHTDRKHSIIRFPQRGADHEMLEAKLIAPQQFSNSAVRTHMTLVGSKLWKIKVSALDAQETQRNHYYWHTQTGFNYCHYRDGWGYQWYGWYSGAQYFWTRYFEGRWWWYDSNLGRWCFWNHGFWWWQDPYHIADLYCFDNENYIPCNSARDQVAVTVPNGSNLQSYVSPDGTRMVKLDSNTRDAFLYDLNSPPAFTPVYLASGVESVEFSNTNDGRPLEIILKLNDGSFDMFDEQGNAYNPEASNSGEAGPGAGPMSSPPATGPPGNPQAEN